MRRGVQGFSLVELLIAVALLGAMLLAAADLWDSSIRLLAATGRALRNPSLVPAAAALRRDVQGAVAVPVPAFDWSQAPLPLAQPDGRSVSYEQRGDALFRAERSLTGSELGERRLLTSVGSFRWRAAAPGLLEVRLTLDLYPEPSPVTASAAPAALGRRVPRTEVLRFAIRGAAGDSSW